MRKIEKYCELLDIGYIFQPVALERQGSLGESNEIFITRFCNVNFEDISSTQLALPAEMGGLGVSSASLLALPGFLASSFGAIDFLTTIFSETFEDVSCAKALQK